MSADDKRVEVDIAYLADSAARELMEAMPTLRDAQAIEKGQAVTKAVLAEEGGAATLKAAIKGDSSFGALREGWIQQRGGFGMMVQDHVLPSLLIRGVIDGESAKSLVDEARGFAKSRTCTTKFYTPLAGVRVGEVISLGDDIELLPWAHVPNGEQKTTFSEKSAFSMGNFPQFSAFANSAVCIRTSRSEVLFPSNEDAKTVAEDPAAEMLARSLRVQDVIRCITALIGHVVAEIGRWSQFSERIANGITGAGYQYGPTLFESGVRTASSKPVALDGKSIARLVAGFSNFKAAEKEVMRVALDRLGQALRRPSIVDKAIDLGIAIEVMLLHGIGTNDRGELRYRSSIRGATFLGGTKSERLETFGVLRAAYDLRSKAVHSGALKDEKKARPPTEILSDATTTCCRIALKLIDESSFPDWDSEYVIGGDDVRD